jgi:hypothetical protein
MKARRRRGGTCENDGGGVGAPPDSGGGTGSRAPESGGPRPGAEGLCRDGQRESAAVKERSRVRVGEMDRRTARPR